MEKTFIRLIRDNSNIIYKICHLYCPGEEDRKDLFQEIVLQLWKSFPGFRNQSLPGTWIYRVALNTAISNIRRPVNRMTMGPLPPSSFLIPDLFDHAAENEQLSLLKLAIGHLTEIEKAIIMLYLEENSYEEMSEILGISKNNIGVKISRIKIKLETIIKKSNS